MPARRRFPLARLLLALALLGVALGLVWRYAVRDHVVPKNFGIVEPGRVYRSGELTPSTTRQVVEKYGIRTIIDLGTFEPGSAGDSREQRTARALGVTRYVFNLEGDSRGNPNEYVQALRLMTDPANQPVLVHCGAGSERTGAAIILYRHIIQNVPMSEAYDEACHYRHNPARNPWLFKTLLDFGGKIEVAYREGGLVPGAPPLPPPLPHGDQAAAAR